MKATFLLLFLYTSIYAQNSIVKVDGKEIPILDNSFTYKDTIQKIFLKTNSTTIWNLRAEITRLIFDHCNHNEINLLLYADSTGAISPFQIITGTDLPKIDSMVISIVKSYSNKFKPAVFNNSSVRSLIYVKYRFHNKSMEDQLLRTNGNYNVSEVLLKFNSQMNSIRNPDSKEVNECTDDNYFFDEGVKCLQQGDFGKAIYNFSQALNANPLDMDATYNMGLAYQKNDKLKKACKCFSDGMERSDTSCVGAFNKYCTEINKK